MFTIFRLAGPKASLVVTTLRIIIINIITIFILIFIIIKIFIFIIIIKISWADGQLGGQTTQEDEQPDARRQ